MKMPQERFGATLQEKTHSYMGIIIAILIILLLGILGGLYLWAQNLQQNAQLSEVIEENVRPTAEENNEPESNNAEAAVQVLETVSNSDELYAIEADLESTQVEGFEADVNAIDAALAQ